MKKLFLLIFSILTIGVCKAQVGVNIGDPQGILHIDPKKNTNTSTSPASNASDDVVIDNNGNLGIGTANPEAKLHVAGNAKTDGSTSVKGNTNVSGNVLVEGKTGLGTNAPAAKLEIVTDNIASGLRIENSTGGNLYMTSDDKGNGTWKSYVRPNSVFKEGVICNEKDKKVVSVKTGGTSAYVDITKQSITLDKGKWLIISKCILRTTHSGCPPNLYMWMCLKENGVVVNQVGIQPEASGWRIGTPQVTYIAHISEPKEYRIGAYIVSPGHTFWTFGNDTLYSEGSFFGMPYFHAIKLDDQ